MKLEDIKTGMKVKLLGKHGCVDNYDYIEDWFKNYYDMEDVQQIEKQGYAVVIDICKVDEIVVTDGICKVNEIVVTDGISTNGWLFLPSDLAPYKEEEVINKNNDLNNVQQQNKTPKEWLLTPLSHFTVKTGDECITLGNGTSYVISNGKLWCSNLNEKYNEDLTDVNNRTFENIIKITYEGEVVWERKEEIKKMTLKEIEKELGYKIAIVSE